MSFGGIVSQYPYAEEKKTSFPGVVIWLHGLGADSSDMKSLAFQPAIAHLNLQHVFLDAPRRPVTLNAGMEMQAWYDIIGLTRHDKEDKAGILSSEKLVLAAIEEQLQKGFKPEQIFLAGFSQGGAMALYTALHYKKPLGGVLSLSGYLPLVVECQAHLPKTVPIFLALGLWDTIVLPQMTEQTAQWLNKAGYTQVKLGKYPMEHSISLPEIEDMALWLKEHLKRSVQA